MSPELPFLYAAIVLALMGLGWLWRTRAQRRDPAPPPVVVLQPLVNTDFAQLAETAARQLEQASVLIAAATASSDPMGPGPEHHACLQAQLAVSSAIRYLRMVTHGGAAEGP